MLYYKGVMAHQTEIFPISDHVINLMFDLVDGIFRNVWHCLGISTNVHSAYRLTYEPKLCFFHIWSCEYTHSMGRESESLVLPVSSPFKSWQRIYLPYNRIIL